MTTTRVHAPRLERRLATAGARAVSAVETRNALIREASAAGLTNRQIAEAVSLSHVAVAKILARS